MSIFYQRQVKIVLVESHACQGCNSAVLSHTLLVMGSIRNEVLEMVNTHITCGENLLINDIGDLNKCKLSFLMFINGALVAVKD